MEERILFENYKLQCIDATGHEEDMLFKFALGHDKASYFDKIIRFMWAPFFLAQLVFTALYVLDVGIATAIAGEKIAHDITYGLLVVTIAYLILKMFFYLNNVSEKWLWNMYNTRHYGKASFIYFIIDAHYKDKEKLHNVIVMDKDGNKVARFFFDDIVTPSEFSEEDETDYYDELKVDEVITDRTLTKAQLRFELRGEKIILVYIDNY